MILVTGGAGFVGSHVIKRLRVEYPDTEIVSLDNYTSGHVRNHIEGVQYWRGDTWEADRLFKDMQFDEVYHFGEYSRIHTSFDDQLAVYKSNLLGTAIIVQLAAKWGAKLIYSATSSGFGNNGKDQNKSPYSWSKAKGVELIKNQAQWFDLDYSILYFFNVYGPGQIESGHYATVIGIWDQQRRNGQAISVVKPGTQERHFTHIDDIVEGIFVGKKDVCSEYLLYHPTKWTLDQIAQLYSDDTIWLPERRGDRHVVELPKLTTPPNWIAKRDLKDWI